MRPLIAVTPLTSRSHGGYKMMLPYLQGVEQAGGAPVVLPLTQQADVLETILEHCSGLIITGGQDVEPARYGQEMLPACGRPDLELDRMEGWLLDWALERDVPVLTVCRGTQFLNVHLGGTLYQDLPTQRPGGVNHSQEPPYDQPIHKVTIREGGFLAGMMGGGELDVNSFHHQAVDQVAPGLEVDAVAEDGLVEAVHLPEKSFVLGLQWHPEFFLDQPASKAIFDRFVRECERWSDK